MQDIYETRSHLVLRQAATFGGLHRTRLCWTYAIRTDFVDHA